MNKDFEDCLKKHLDFFKNELLSAVVGVANPKMVSDIMIKGKGPVSKFAAITTKGSKEIYLILQDKSMATEIDRAIRHLGKTIVNADNITLELAPISGEEIQRLRKQVTEQAENAKIKMRNSRHDYINLLKPLEKSDKDAYFKQNKKLQEIFDKYKGEIETALKKKLTLL